MHTLQIIILFMKFCNSSLSVVALSLYNNLTLHSCGLRCSLQLHVLRWQIGHRLLYHMALITTGQQKLSLRRK